MAQRSVKRASSRRVDVERNGVATDVGEFVTCPACGILLARMNISLHELHCSRRVAGSSSSAINRNDAPSQSDPGTFAGNRTQNSGSGSTSSSDQRVWQCSRCTYQNSTSQSQCTICAYGREADEMLVARMDSNLPGFGSDRQTVASSSNAVSGRISGSQPDLDQSGSSSVTRRRTQNTGSNSGRRFWQCTRCTYDENSVSRTRCEVCGYNSQQDERLRSASRQGPRSTTQPHNNDDMMFGALGGVILGGLTGAAVSAMSRDERESSGSALLRGGIGGALFGAFLGATAAAVANDEPASRASQAPPMTSGDSVFGGGNQNSGQTPDLYEMLMNLFPSDSGPRRPASRESIRELPTQELRTNEDIARLCGDSNTPSDDSKPTCTICLMEFEISEHVKRLPCFHIFHDECITRWLRQSNSCPLCVADIH
uniref:RING-type E3 ubiquitin transferase n=1 Tax=Timspurckia oligopyrenoides TaxID=708627 RepID=A0A7S0ZCS5_9RHOD|mmetsp:Transcript_12774/g.22969  ORF Transcript_12774/g.22969 Transcript_12774/m.22969 type:complete len:427 (+) Transcript_12774:42-1322(+)